MPSLGSVLRNFKGMGKHWRKKSRKGQKGRLGVRRQPRGAWTDIVKENEPWEKYYKAQKVVDTDEEFATMKKAFQQPLPLTFRITGTSDHVKDVSSFFTGKIVPQLEKAEKEAEKIAAQEKLAAQEKPQEEKVSGEAPGESTAEPHEKVRKSQPPAEPVAHCPPFALPWYPRKLAYQIDLPKRVIKKDPVYAPVQQFLVAENDVGNISRQEAVSMIPPLFLDVKPSHFVLDMCAAPGSKTAQLVEALHSTKNGELPTGFVVANDSDYRRSFMLVHQIKRLNSPNYVIVNHDAQMFPKVRLQKDGPNISYDRILCDVPCSGDGTFRKNVAIWNEWHVGNGLGLHRLQLNILIRGIQLLKAGGRLVYSTCSLNPIEDEAVVASALKAFKGIVKTVDCSQELPSLKRHPGMETWKVFNKTFEEQKEPNDENSDVPATAFPPLPEEVKDLHLENCMRVYPHYQNTGGFFITVLEKSTDAVKAPKKRTREENSDEAAVKKQKTDKSEVVVKPIVAPVPSKKQKLPFDAIEEPFSYVAPDNKDIAKCWKFYEIDDSFPKKCAMVRNATGEPMRSIYFTSENVKKVIENNQDKLKLVYAGVKLFVYQKNYECPWRIQNDSVDIIKHCMPPTRQVHANMAVFKILLEEGYPSIQVINEKEVDSKFVDEITGAPEGSCFLSVDQKESENLLLPIWKGKVHINLMVDKQEKAELLYRFFGVNKTEIERRRKIEKEKRENEKAKAEMAAKKDEKP